MTKPAPYGYCPYCDQPGISRERRLDGNDRCSNGHIYPSAQALTGLFISDMPPPKKRSTVMRHLEEALEAYMRRYGESHYIELRGDDHSITFTIQDGPIKEVGENGCQAEDMLKYLIRLYMSLQLAFPCRENEFTIRKLEEALHWQQARTADREHRRVEGLNKA